MKKVYPAYTRKPAHIFGGTIPDGTRNITLTRIAGLLHDGTRNLRQLTADLLVINNARCEPPLPRNEVCKIAASIHKRRPCKRRPGDVGEAVCSVLAMYLDEMDLYAQQTDSFGSYWCGVAGNTDRSVLFALVRHAAKFGTLIPSGVRVSISMRQLALEAGVSLPTASRSVSRLRRADYLPRLCSEPWLSRDDAGRAAHEAGAFVLRLPGIPESALSLYTYPPTVHAGIDVNELRAPDTNLEHFLDWGKTFHAEWLESVPPLRWRGLGKRCELVLRALVRLDGEATVAEIAEWLGDKRPRDLLRDSPGRTGALTRLARHNIVELRGDLVTLVPEWCRELDLARDHLGEHATAAADSHAYEEQRERCLQYLTERRSEGRRYP